MRESQEEKKKREIRHTKRTLASQWGVSFATRKDVVRRHTKGCRKLPLQTGTYLTGVDESRQSSAMVQCALSSRSPGDENDSAEGVKPETRG
jgi:hypothetical protein